MVDDNAGVGVSAQTSVIGPQITGFLQRFRCRVNAQVPIIRNYKFLKIFLVRILKDFLINGFAPEIPERVLQNALVVSLLTAENDIPQPNVRLANLFNPALLRCLEVTFGKR